MVRSTELDLFSRHCSRSRSTNETLVYLAGDRLARGLSIFSPLVPENDEGPHPGWRILRRLEERRVARRSSGPPALGRESPLPQDLGHRRLTGPPSPAGVIN